MHHTTTHTSRLTGGLLLTLLFAAVFLFPQAARAATVVPCGVIELATWTPAGSPYLITCDVQVDSLTIQPGVTVLFLSNSVFQVTGFLHANGTAGAPILFTSTNPAVKWQGIFFQEVAPGSVLVNCVIEGSGNSGVRIEQCVVAITNCMIRNNMAPHGGGININNTVPGLGEVAISGCTISNNSSILHGGGISAIIASGRLKLVQSSVISNVAGATLALSDPVGGGIRVQGNSILLNCFVGYNSCNGRGQSFVNCGYASGGGIYSDSGTSNWKNCFFVGNVAQRITGQNCGAPGYGFGGAVYFDSGQLSMQNCIVVSNICNEGAGIYQAGGTASIINSTIVGNNTHGVTRVGGTVNCLNSIVYFNNGGNVPFAGAVNFSYCDVQGGVPPGLGNKSVNPSLNFATLRINASSQCIDMGDPNPIYNDLCFPPSRGTAFNDMGAHGGPGACCWDAPCNCPVVGELQTRTTCVGMNVTFCVTAAGAEPITYQWRYHGLNASNPPVNIGGATAACLPLSNVQTNQAGYYSVRVSNPICIVDSNPALLLVFPVCFSLDLYPGLSITGQVGRAYVVQSTPDLSGTPVWTSLTNFTLATPTYFYRDPQPARHCESTLVAPPRRFYRVIEAP